MASKSLSPPASSAPGLAHERVNARGEELLDIPATATPLLISHDNTTTIVKDVATIVKDGDHALATSPEIHQAHVLPSNLHATTATLLTRPESAHSELRQSSTIAKLHAQPLLVRDALGNVEEDAAKDEPPPPYLSDDDIFNVTGSLGFASFTADGESERHRNRFSGRLSRILNRTFTNRSSFLLPRERSLSLVQNELRGLTLNKYQVPVCIDAGGEKVFIEIALVNHGTPNFMAEELLITLGLQDRLRDLDPTERRSFSTPDGGAFVPSGKVVLPKPLSFYHKTIEKWYRSTSFIMQEVFYVGSLDPDFGHLIINGDGRKDNRYLPLHNQAAISARQITFFNHGKMDDLKSPLPQAPSHGADRQTELMPVTMPDRIQNDGVFREETGIELLDLPANDDDEPIASDPQELIPISTTDVLQATFTRNMDHETSDSRLHTNLQSLHEAICDQDMQMVHDILASASDDITTPEFEWLQELIANGNSLHDIAQLLIENEIGSQKPAELADGPRQSHVPVKRVTARPVLIKGREV